MANKNSKMKPGWLLLNIIFFAVGLAFFIFSYYKIRNIDSTVEQSKKEISEKEAPKDVFDLAANVETINSYVYYGSSSDKYKLTQKTYTITKQPSFKDMARELLTLLETSPDNERLFPVVPKGVSIRSVFIHENLLIMDLSEEISNLQIAGITAEMETIQAITWTFLETFPTMINGVKFLINGKESDTLKGHLSLETPFRSRSFEL